LHADPGQLVTLNQDPDGRNPYPRMTLTYAGLARARLIIFTVAGAAKREAMQAIVDGADLPAAQVTADKILWLVDHEAAPSGY
jgi:6-phosphogluconolactonase/glucosamine-6-phosphate isomerase/deaminase